MREILFRGMDFGGIWRYGFYLPFNHPEESYRHRICTTTGDYRIKKETVGQYTGVDAKTSARKGEHSLKIFEGDFVQVLAGETLNGLYELDMLANVIFASGSFYMVDRKKIHWNFSEPPITNIDLDSEYEITGNLHE